MSRYPHDIFEQADAEERRERAEVARRQNEAVAELDAAQDAARKERARLHSLRTNDMLIAQEYERAGVRPLQLNGRGVPTVSLALLLRMGWTIVQDGDRNMLAAPPAQPAKPRKRREDYDQSS